MKSVIFLFISLSTISAFANEFQLVRTGSATVSIYQETGEGDLDIAIASNNLKNASEEDSATLSSILIGRLELGKITQQPFFFQSSNSYFFEALSKDIEKQIDRRVYGSTQIGFLGRAKFETHETILKSFSCIEVRVPHTLKRSQTIVKCDMTFESTITGVLR